MHHKDCHNLYRAFDDLFYRQGSLKNSYQILSTGTSKKKLDKYKLQYSFQFQFFSFQYSIQSCVSVALAPK